MFILYRRILPITLTGGWFSVVPVAKTASGRVKEEENLAVEKWTEASRLIHYACSVKEMHQVPIHFLVLTLFDTVLQARVHMLLHGKSERMPCISLG